jgi:glutathione S-transferase
MFVQLGYWDGARFGSMITLYYSPVACSLASHIVLEEIGAPYETRATHILKEEHRAEDYLKINPRGRIPVLLVDGAVLTETVAILVYLAQRYPEAKLLPTDIFQFAKCLSMMAWLSSAVHPSFRHFGRPERFAGDPAAFASIKETGRQTFWAYCREIDGFLKGKNWAMGDQYTVCDPYILVFYAWFFLPERPINLPLQEIPNYTEFVKRMAQRPAVRRILKKEESPLMRFVSDH